MKKENLDKVLSMIKGIEKKNLELEKLLSSLNVSTRNDMLRDISNAIIKKNEIFQDLNLKREDLCAPKIEVEKDLSSNYMEELILKIKTTPSKSVIILKDFLDKLKDISDSDKKVILKSLKDKSPEEIQKELENLVKIFGLKI